jgi:hypothetical protein
VKLGVLVGGRLLIATIRQFQGSSRALEGHAIFRIPAVFRWMLDSINPMMNLIQDFQCRVVIHILTVVGVAL